jgi:NAD(P) transhydrogenase subunit alpha
MEAIDPFVFRLSIFVLAIFVGYFVVWAVTPALHTPLMSVTNAISSVIVVGALIAVSVSPLGQHMSGWTIYAPYSGAHPPSVDLTAQIGSLEARAAMGHFANSAWISKGFGFFALILASVNIFGGFLVTSRMLAMYKKKEKSS